MCADSQPVAPGVASKATVTKEPSRMAGNVHGPGALANHLARSLRRRRDPGKGQRVTERGRRSLSYFSWAIVVVAVAESLSTLLGR